MKFGKGNLVGCSRELSTGELLSFIAAIKATVQWKSRAKRVEVHDWNLFYPRLVDFRYVDFFNPSFPSYEMPIRGNCAGVLGSPAFDLNLQDWERGPQESGLVSASVAIDSSECFPKKLNDTFQRRIRFSFGHDGKWSLCCYGLDKVPGNDAQKVTVFQQLLDAAGYSERLRVKSIISMPKYPPLRCFILEKLDPELKAYYFANDPRARTAHSEPYLELGPFQNEAFADYPELAETTVGKWILAKNIPFPPRIEHFQDWPSGAETVVPARLLHVNSLSFGQAIEIHKAWLRIFYADTTPVVSNVRFCARSHEQWPQSRAWLSHRLPGPWTLFMVTNTRGRVENVESLIAEDVGQDCLIPLCFWRASVGPRLMVDVVSNKESKWELWIHVHKPIGHKRAAIIRDELASLSGIPDLFAGSQDFPWGGWSDFVINS